MTPCQKYKADLLRMVDDELEQGSKKEIDKHLEECPDCSGFIKELLRLRSHLKSLSPIKTSDGFQYLLRERIRREMSGKRVRQSQWKTHWAPAFAAMVMMVISGYMFVNRDHSGIAESASQNTIAQQPVLQNPAYDQVDYVLDSETLVEKKSTQEKNQNTVIDSSARERNLKNIQARITPVSF